MELPRVVTAVSLGLLLCLGSPAVRADVEEELDIYFVPTPNVIVDEMLRLAEVQEGDVVYDRGSGDGRIVITAAERYGTRGVGIDLDPERIAESEQNARTAGVEERVRFIQGNLFDADLQPASVVTLYLLTSINERLRPKLLRELRPGTRVVSHAFGMGSWEPDRQSYADGAKVFLWVIPAAVQGRWAGVLDGPDGEAAFSLLLEQKYQDVDGMAVIGDAHMAIDDAHVTGEELHFTVTDGNGHTLRLTGTVGEETIEGEIEGDGRAPAGRWSARRDAIGSVGDQILSRTR